MVIFQYPHNAAPSGTFGLLISLTREYKLTFLKQYTFCRRQSTLTSTLPMSHSIYSFTYTTQFHDGTDGHSVLSAAMMKVWKHLGIKLNIYNVLIKSSLLYGSETWRLTEDNKRRVEATERDALRRSSRISIKERIRNVTIRHQIGLEETIIKETEQNQLTCYGHV